MFKKILKRSVKIVDQKKQKESMIEWGDLAFFENEPSKKISLSNICPNDIKGAPLKVNG